MQRRRIRITGQVQGVGFRPFVYRLAVAGGLTGEVRNDASGVTIEAQGDGEQLDRFAVRLRAELPPLAEIHSMDSQPVESVAGESQFVIAPSAGGELADAQVTVDTAVCADCLREMRDPDDPRYAYPFINCTQCGPRYTIVREIPYDRPNTTMSGFEMCAMCRREYNDPLDRRFHAQPVACPRCGPKIWLADSRGTPIETDDVIAAASERLADGRIVAIRGLGGFHLACRADDDHAVRRLRRRKYRDAKPFAVMVADLPAAAELVEINDAAERLLAGSIRPIVLLPRLAETPVAESVAYGLDTLGVMLPYTPIHHLLFDRRELAGVPLVMTSGNYTDQPLVKDNDEAIANLGRIADAMLLHDRPIARRVDDSVVQVTSHGRETVFRRARGYAPRPVRLELDELDGAPPVLGVGPELKNTVCLLSAGRAVVSEHIGDLKEARTYRHFVATIGHLQRLFEVTAELVSADLHPQYLSTGYALKRHRGESSDGREIPIERVQHHHAHIAAVLAEHGRAGPVIGLAADGVGYGDDGAVWGCEVFHCDLREYRRLGHLRYTPLPGGDAASRQTYRPALAALWDTFAGEVYDMDLARRLAGGDDVLAAAVEMLSAGVNCPPSSSLGRWFDAAAAICGVAGENRYEAEAPMLLESIAAPDVANAYAFRIGHDPAGGDAFLIDLRPTVEEMVRDVRAGYDPGVVSARFHNTVADFLLAAAERARELTGAETVAISGGCFANRTMTGRLLAGLAGRGFETLTHLSMPCNDGCVSLGQAVVAAARRAHAVRR